MTTRLKFRSTEASRREVRMVLWGVMFFVIVAMGFIDWVSH